MSKPAPKSHAWELLSLHFRQQFEQGYRYLDCCGEFMVKAEDELGFLSSDAQPTGAKLIHPEEGIQLELDTSGLVMSQHRRSSTIDSFASICRSTSRLTVDLLRPKQIFHSGLSIKLHSLFPSEQAVLDASLRIGGHFPEHLADSLGMNPLHQSRSFALDSGSYELRVSIKPVCFTQKGGGQQPHGFRQTKQRRKRIERQNASEKLRISPKGYALSIEVDLQETNPPEDGLLQQAATLEKCLEKILSDASFQT